MSEFSKIVQMDPTTISRPPKYTAQSAASSPIQGGNDEQSKKSKHIVLKTAATILVAAAAVALARKFAPTMFDPNAVLKADATWMDKGLYYTKKYIGVAGEFINSNIQKLIDWGKDLMSKGSTTPSGTTPPATPAP